MHSRKIFSILLVYLFLSSSLNLGYIATAQRERPTPHEFALMSQVAYLKPENDNNVPNWRELTRSSEAPLTSSDVREDDQLGYFGMAFINNTRDIIVIAHRGTDSGSDLGDDYALGINQQVPEQYESARVFHQQVIERANLLEGLSQGDYDLYFTGHSLGGALAEISAVNTGNPAVTFDSPGVTQEMLDTYGSASMNTDIDIIGYLGPPNFVNTANLHIGNIIMIYTPDEVETMRNDSFGILGSSYWDYTVGDNGAHNLAGIIARIDRDSGYPIFEYDDIEDWWPTSFDEGREFYENRVVIPDPPVDTTQIESEPCTVSTNNQEITVRVGPGGTRTALTFMPVNTSIPVLGIDETGAWYRVDKELAAPNKMSEQAWIAITNDLVVSGNCDLSSVEVLVPPPIIPIQPPTRTPAPNVTTNNVTSVSSGNPNINFRSTAYNIPALDCVTISWDVTGGGNVFYEDTAVGASGNRQYCLDRTTTYELRVVQSNGQESTEYVTVNVDNSSGLGGGDIEFTLQWNNTSDLDLFVREPGGTVIYFGNTRSGSGGNLVLDANFPCGTNLVYAEDINWPSGSAPSGTYQVWVQETSRCGSSQAANWTITARVDGNIVLTRSGTGASSTYSVSR